MNLGELVAAAEYEAMYLAYYGAMEFAEPAPNPMFSPLQLALTTFVRPANDAKWTCAVCGCKRGRKWFWTQILPFRALSLSGFNLEPGDLLEALTPVCADHPIRPACDFPE